MREFKFIRKNGKNIFFVAHRQKRRDTRLCASSFLVWHFCCAKVVACGRMTEREWGNPQRFPPHTPPFPAVCGSTDNKTCGQSRKSHPKGWLFFLARAIGTAYLTMAAVPCTMAENTAREGYHGILEDERGRQ